MSWLSALSIENTWNMAPLCQGATTVPLLNWCTRKKKNPRPLNVPHMVEAWKTPEGGAAHRKAARDGMRRWTAVSTVLGLAVLLQVVEASPTALQRRSAVRLAGRRELTDNDRYTWMYAVGDNGMIMTSRPQEEGGGKPESGKQWLPLVSGSQEHLHDVMFISARSGLVVGAKSTVLQTSNLGNEWEAIDLGLPSPCNLYGVFIMAEGGPTYIVGEKGLFISSPDGETFTSTSLVCTVPGKECTQQTVSAGWNSNIVLHGARFRDADNGVLVGTNGTVILVQGGKEEGDRTFFLLKPVQFESSGVLGPRFPDFLDVSSDDLGDMVASGTHGVVLKLVSKSRKQDDGVDWDLSASQVGASKPDSAFASVPNGGTLELSGSVDTILYSTEMLSLDPENRKKQILVTGSAGFYCLYDGTAWKKCENSRLEAAASAKITASYMPTGNTIVLSTENGKIFRSKNSGSLFEAVATTSIDQKWPSGIKVNRMFGRNAEQSALGTRTTAGMVLSVFVLFVAHFALA